MAKINIILNNKTYQIDESSLADAIASLKSHLSTTMAGSGATINLGGTTYNIDSTKLSTATADFIAHLGTIAGSGMKVVVGGVEYSVDSSKVAGAFEALEGTLSGLQPEVLALAPGLYQSGAIALMQEQGEETIADMLIKSWDDMLASGEIIVADGTVSPGMVVPELPTKNEYGFYFGVIYTVDGVGLKFFEDGSVEMYAVGTLMQSAPAGSVTYTVGSIDMSALEMGIATISEDGTKMLFTDLGAEGILGEAAQFAGDLFIPNNKGIEVIRGFGMHTALTGIVIPEGTQAIDNGAFGACEGLTNVIIPGSVTYIGQDAFSECTGLEKVTFSSAPSLIGSNAFFRCNSLTSVVIPDNAVEVAATIGSNAFCQCNNLTDVVIGTGVTTIGYQAFSGCDSLKNVVLSDDLDSIYEQAFGGCRSITSITLPNSVSFIGDFVFNGCSSLISINFNGTVTEWEAITKYRDWKSGMPATYVQCSDGQVAL